MTAYAWYPPGAVTAGYQSAGAAASTVAPFACYADVAITLRPAERLVTLLSSNKENQSREAPNVADAHTSQHQSAGIAACVNELYGRGGHDHRHGEECRRYAVSRRICARAEYQD